jgi:hypothetical protein
MNVKFAHAVATVISSVFPGGIIEFNKMGRVTVLPHPSRDVVIYHPSLPETVKAKLLAVQDSPNNKYQSKIHFMSTQNFANLEDEGLVNIDQALVNFLNKIYPSASMLLEHMSNLIVVSLVNMEEGDAALDLTLRYLENLPGMILAFVTTRERTFQVEPIPNRSKSKIIPIPGNEHGVITQEDVTNFIIDIERCNSVDDIINGA